MQGGWSGQSDAHKIIQRQERTSESGPPRDNRRSYGRLHCLEIDCNIGPVLDLSAGGMRVISPVALDGPIDVEMLDVEPDLCVKAQVAWSTRLASGEYEVGLRFVDLTRESAHRLSVLATQRREQATKKAG
jgi:hypothetical protein